MSSPYPALRAKFGNTDYYLTAMPVGVLIKQIVFPANLPNWDDLGIEEKFQRKLDMKRIKRDIAPYFATDSNRFSGSLVLAVMNDEKMTFEPLDKFVGTDNTIPKLYDEAIEDMGFFIMSGGSILVPLDGQHRAKAFELAIRGDNDGDGVHSTIQTNPELAKEKVAVILIRFDNKKARYIFNKINKYAKPTTKANKLITDDDNAISVIVRQMIHNDIIPEYLISLDKNALNKTTHEFTTLSTFNDASMHLLGSSKIPIVSNPEKMSEIERRQRLEEISKEWKRLISGIDLWKKSLQDPTKKGNDTRIKIRKEYLLNKPIGQLALVGGYAFACKRDERISRDVLIKRLNKINWKVNAKIWSRVLIRENGRIMAGTSAKNNAIKFIAHLIGTNLTKEEKDGLLEWIYGDKWKRKKLPEQIK